MISGNICRLIPAVRGIEPRPCKGHSAVLLNEDRILVIKKGSSSDDCLWFLEVRFWRTEAIPQFVETLFNLGAKQINGNYD